jgi:hypothetical protein
MAELRMEVLVYVNCEAGGTSQCSTTALEAAMAQVIGQALAMMFGLLVLRLIYKFSLNLTNNLENGSQRKSVLVKGVFVVLALAPWVGMFVYVKFYS